MDRVIKSEVFIRKNNNDSVDALLLVQYNIENDPIKDKIKK